MFSILVALKYQLFSLKFLKKYWNLQTSFPDMEIVCRLKLTLLWLCCTGVTVSLQYIRGKAFAAAFVKVSIYSLIDSLESGEGLEFYMYIPKSIKAPAFCSLCGGELINKTKTFCHHAIHMIFPLHPKHWVWLTVVCFSFFFLSLFMNSPKSQATLSHSLCRKFDL